MNTIKCKYNWDEATVELLFSDGTKVALLCKGIEADLSIGIKAQGKLQALKVEKPSEYWDGVKRHSASLLRCHRPFRQHKHPGERFIMITDNKDFRLTTGYGKIKQTEEHITITTKSSRYIFKI